MVAERDCVRHVAPYVGAWIETKCQRSKATYPQSLPTWERGLKPWLILPIFVKRVVAPYVGAWIETHPFYVFE